MRAFQCQKCSPRVWGWPGKYADWMLLLSVFPTGVGMALFDMRTPREIISVPHGCGDGPTKGQTIFGICSCSPRVWGWPDHRPKWPQDCQVFPTGVGMARHIIWPRLLRGCVPHGCGDGPGNCLARSQRGWCSPRVWGWPADGVSLNYIDKVFPTGVGMAR